VGVRKEIKHISDIYKHTIKFFGVVFNSKFDSLITDNPVCTLDKVFTINCCNFIQPVQVKIASIENIGKN